MVFQVKGNDDGEVRESRHLPSPFQDELFGKWRDNFVKMLCQWALAFSRSEN